MESEKEENLPLPAVKGIISSNFSLLLRYMKLVSEELGKEKALELLGDLSSQSRVEWYRQNKDEFEDLPENAIGAKKVLKSFMEFVTPGWEEDEFKILEESPEKVRFRFSGFCAWLEACKNTELDTEEVCPYASQQASNELFEEIDPDLKLEIEKMRPEKEHCEEIIRMENRN